MVHNACSVTWVCLVLTVSIVRPEMISQSTNIVCDMKGACTTENVATFSFNGPFAKYSYCNQGDNCKVEQLDLTSFVLNATFIPSSIETFFMPNIVQEASCCCPGGCSITNWCNDDTCHTFETYSSGCVLPGDSVAAFRNNVNFQSTRAILRGWEFNDFLISGALSDYHVGQTISVNGFSVTVDEVSLNESPIKAFFLGITDETTTNIGRNTELTVIGNCQKDLVGWADLGCTDTNCGAPTYTNCHANQFVSNCEYSTDYQAIRGLDAKFSWLAERPSLPIASVFPSLNTDYKVVVNGHAVDLRRVNEQRMQWPSPMNLNSPSTVAFTYNGNNYIIVHARGNSGDSKLFLADNDATLATTSNILVSGTVTLRCKGCSWVSTHFEGSLTVKAIRCLSPYTFVLSLSGGNDMCSASVNGTRMILSDVTSFTLTSNSPVLNIVCGEEGFAYFCQTPQMDEEIILTPATTNELPQIPSSSGAHWAWITFPILFVCIGLCCCIECYWRPGRKQWRKYRDRKSLKKTDASKAKPSITVSAVSDDSEMRAVVEEREGLKSYYPPITSVNKESPPTYKRF